MAKSVEHWDRRIGRRIRLRDLHVLLTVVQRGSMAKAAEHLAVSQPAISKAISDLEMTLGVKLLDRGRRGVEPTLYGSALVRRGLIVFDELRQGVGEIEFLADPTVGEVKVGCVEWVLATLLPPVIERLSRQYPGVRVQATEMNPVTLEFRELYERNIDLLIGRRSLAVAEDVNAEELIDDPLVIVASAQSRWIRRRKMDLSDLIGEKWLLYPLDSGAAALIDTAFRARGLTPPQPSVATFSHYLRDILLGTGDYLTIIPASMLNIYNRERLRVRALPVKLGLQAAPMAIFTLKSRTLSPVTALFIECIRSTAKSMARSNLKIGTYA